MSQHGLQQPVISTTMVVFVTPPLSFTANRGTWFQTQQQLLCEMISKSMNNVFMTHRTTRLGLWLIIMQLNKKVEEWCCGCGVRYCYTWLCSHSLLSWGKKGNNGVLGLLRALQLIHSPSPVCSQWKRRGVCQLKTTGQVSSPIHNTQEPNVWNAYEYQQ